MFDMLHESENDVNKVVSGFHDRVEWRSVLFAYSSGERRDG